MDNSIATFAPRYGPLAVKLATWNLRIGLFPSRRCEDQRESFEMTKTSPKPGLKTAAMKAAAFTTATIVSFSLTLLAGSIAVLSGLVPLTALSFGERTEVGAMLFIAPVLALVLAVVFEASRIAFTRAELPEPRRQQAVRWSPGRREG